MFWNVSRPTFTPELTVPEKKLVGWTAWTQEADWRRNQTEIHQSYWIWKHGTYNVAVAHVAVAFLNPRMEELIPHPRRSHW